MRFALLSALKDLRRMRRDPLSLAPAIGTPLLLAVLLVAIFGHEQPKPQGLIMIADQDKSILSALVLHVYTQDKLGEIFTVQQVPLDAGLRRIKSGDGSALVIIPKGFSQAVFGNEQATMQLITNPAQSILPGIAESVTSILVEGAWRLQQLAGDELKQLSGKGEPSDDMIASSSIRFRRIGEGIHKFLDPPVIKVSVEVVDPNPKRSQINTSAVMFTSMTFMSILFLAASVAGDIWKDKSFGILRQVAVSPRSLSGFLGGRIIALWTVFAIIAIVSLLVGKIWIRAEIHNAVFAVLWFTASGGALYLLFVLLHTSFRNPRGATTLSSLLMMLFGMLGGSFFPFEYMPDTLARIGRCLPNGWAMLQFKDILAGQVLPSRLAMDFCAVLGFTLLLFIVAAWQLRRKFLY
jgi:ABC-type multidrug transport system permease subunit